MIDGLHCSDLFLNFPLEEQRKYSSAISHVVLNHTLTCPPLAFLVFHCEFTFSPVLCCTTKTIITNGSALVLVQNTEATQMFVQTGHDAYGERKLPVASTPSVLYSLPSREIGEWPSVMTPTPGGRRADQTCNQTIESFGRWESVSRSGGAVTQPGG